MTHPNICLFPNCEQPRHDLFYCEKHVTDYEAGLEPFSDRSCELPMCSTRTRGQSRLCEKHKGMAYRFSISPDHLLEIVDRNEGRCHVCLHEQGVNLDHSVACCNKPGSCGDCVRGWVCQKCHWLISTATESKQRLMRMYCDSRLTRSNYLGAIRYLAAYDEPTDRTLEQEFELFKTNAQTWWSRGEFERKTPTLDSLAQELALVPTHDMNHDGLTVTHEGE